MSKNLEKLAQEWFERAASDLKYARAGEKETGEHAEHVLDVAKAEMES